MELQGEFLCRFDGRKLMIDRRVSGPQTEQQCRNELQSCDRGFSTVKKRLWL